MNDDVLAAEAEDVDLPVHDEGTRSQLAFREAKSLLDLGQQAPISPISSRPSLNGAIDRRWLSGTLVAGIAASLLLGTALHAALDGRESLSGRPVWANLAGPASQDFAIRGDRPITIAPPPPPKEKVIRVSTVTQEGESRVIRRKPFGYAAAPLAIASRTADYEPFDALAIYSTSDSDDLGPVTAIIYDAEVESEVTVQRSAFTPGASFHPSTGSEAMALAAVEREYATLLNTGVQNPALLDRGADSPAIAAANVPALTNSPKTSLGTAVAAIGNVTTEADDLSRPASALAYAPTSEAHVLDPLGHASRVAADEVTPSANDDDTLENPGIAAAALSAALTLAEENVTLIEQMPDGLSDAFAPPASREAVVTLKSDESLSRSLTGALLSYGAERAFVRAVDTVLRARIADEADRPGQLMLRFAYQEAASLSAGPEGTRTQRDVRRISLYRDRQHLTTLARNDAGTIVEAPAPAELELGAAAAEKKRIALARSMPTLYDGVMRAALSQGMTPAHARRLVRIMAFDVDFRSKANPEDRLEIFYSLEEGQERPTAESQILHVTTTIGGVTRRYYRHGHTDAAGKTIVDFYDETGRSSKTFLLRRPVPTGRLTSGYGMRRHPKLRYRKMHTGVDWAAPSGTPILSAGSGVVVKAGWAGGYGRQVKIRHANGYVTSYSHLRRYARGIKPGKRVRQGQRIGQVGTSGLSTGPHLHYEVTVNKRRVNPMRMRLPKGRSLKGKALAAFQRERVRIDGLMQRGRGDTEVASH